MISPPILADLMADPGNCPSAAWTATQRNHAGGGPAACYAADTPFPEVWGRFRCSACLWVKAC
jgi:hypothetical protein